MPLDKRKAGILLPITSLPSAYGIGTLGKEAYAFIDFLHAAKQSYWQILPISYPSLGNSPYSAFSSYAGNPLFIDLDLLREEKLLQKNEYHHIPWGKNLKKVNYKTLWKYKPAILELAVKRFLKKDKLMKFKQFEKENVYWLEDYAIFMTYHQINHKQWTTWPLPIKNRDPKAIQLFKEEYDTSILYQKVIQYFFFKQWYALKKYANKKHIEIIGDIPIYVALDSVDVWANRHLFQLEADGNPSFVAGCPPDAFSNDGQNWMNPLYAWPQHKLDDYAWWHHRIDYLCDIYDILRIDHFRGFDSYFSIPNPGHPKDGHWEQGPGIDFFLKLNQKKTYPLIAEDLGLLTDSVHQLLKDTKYPGMKVIQFAFDAAHPENDAYQPHCYIENCVAYIGTHDNDTLQGYLKHAKKEDVAYMKEYFQITTNKECNMKIIESLYASKANTIIITAQDILNLSSSARMNVPSKSHGNWTWRMEKDALSKDISHQLAQLVKKYNR